MKFFRPRNFFKHFEQFQKLVQHFYYMYQFLETLVDGSWRVTSKLCIRGSTLIQVARRRSKMIQRFSSASLVRVGDVQGVPRQHAVRGRKKTHNNQLGCRKSGKIHGDITCTAGLLRAYFLPNQDFDKLSLRN